MKTELKTFGVSFGRKDGYYTACIRYNPADQRLFLGNSEPNLLDDVIAAVQEHIKDLTEDLQVIREVRSGKKS